MASMSEREKREIEAANASGHTPVVLIHGLWLLPSSWAAWVDFFTEAGYAPLTPDWPDDPGTVAEARANPDVFAKKTLGQIADHTTEVVKALDRRPALVGHSTPGSSAGSSRCRSPRSGRLARSWSTRAHVAARSPSRSTSSGTAGRTRWTRPRRGSSTTPSTSRALGCRSCRWATRT
jgi:hypothetical protein